MAAERSAARLRVLLVDDDELARRACGRLLSTLSDVTKVESGAAALDAIAGEPFDAVVTDYRMPAMNGVELLERIRERAPAMRRVLMSAESVFDLERHLASGLAHAFLGKPFDRGNAAAALGVAPPVPQR
jgi:CheY-like chemotaxis protein